MQHAARDLGRLPWLIAGGTGAAITLGIAVLLRSLRGDPPDGPSAVPAAALVPAGPALDAARDEAARLRAEAAQLRTAHANLEAALTFKNDLTSMLTHDVAQPISSIASLAELLRSDWDDLPEDLRLELATKIDKNTQRLIKMMNDLQLLFRLDTGSVTARRNPVPLKEIAEAVAPGEIDVEIGDESVLADRGHVQVVLQNLVNNALAYGGKPVIVSAARHGEQVEVVVRDHGPGIAEDLLPTLFGRFARGAGLGLFIVRHLVEANGGTIRYEHAVPRGARLVVTLEAAGPMPSRPPW
ncbi:HAMP domain-containing histidine kinase [Actinoplanes sp. TRM 88003]|uniref:histidine kinase n=1 Tax=Paractinoplanes aksuensis TaxID=2939490 RepID=A0ABT1DP36_9ACTN|nr:HAMP domain-containing sensor histidine kinase [Actinoplanes aksuensis]MCO8272585.1 HAMP domain-containing histidine kinase [Actinoplanes aksuensis]